MIELLRLFLIIVPMYCANGSALVFGGKKPLDFGIKFIDKKPIFGKGKTIKGSLAGLGAGTLAGTLLFAFGLGFENYLLFSFLSSLGAIFGDLVGSFIKRRINIAPGKDLFLIDQLDFVIGALLFTYGILYPSIYEISAIIILTIFMHKATNYLAFVLKLKKVPW